MVAIPTPEQTLEKARSDRDYWAMQYEKLKLENEEYKRNNSSPFWPILRLSVTMAFVAYLFTFHGSHLDTGETYTILGMLAASLGLNGKDLIIPKG